MGREWRGWGLERGGYEERGGEGVGGDGGVVESKAVDEHPGSVLTLPEDKKQEQCMLKAYAE